MLKYNNVGLTLCSVLKWVLVNMGSCGSKKQKSAIFNLAKQIVTARDDTLSPHRRLAIKSKLQILPFFDNLSRANQAFDAKDAKVVTRDKTPKDTKLIYACFRNNSIFSSLSEQEVSTITESMILFQMGPKEIVIEEGRPGHMYFILGSGTVEVLQNNKRLRILQEGSGFGELALLHNSERLSTVKSLTDIELWGITRDLFKSLVHDISMKNYLENKNFISSIPIFQVLSEQQKDSLIQCLVVQRFSPGWKILTMNEKGNSLFILKEGIAACVIKGEEVELIYPKGFFGEGAILSNTLRNANIVSKTEVVCLIASKQDLLLSLGQQLNKILYHNILYNTIKSHKYLMKLLPEQIEELIKALKFNTVTDSIIIPSGTPMASSIFLTIRGKFLMGSEAIPNFTFIGAEECLFERYTEVCEFDFKCEGEGEFTCISNEEMKGIIPGGYSAVIERNEVAGLLKNCIVLKFLSEETIVKLSRSLVVKEFEEGEKVLNVGEIVSSILIVKEGIFSSSNPEFEYSKFQIIGEKESICENISDFNIKCTEIGSCWVLAISDLKIHIDTDTLLFFKSRLTSKDCLPLLSEIQVIRTDSNSEFSNLQTVVNSKTQSLYSMKTVSKYQMNKPLSRYLKQELQILPQLDHPFLPQFLQTYKDSSRIYMLTTYLAGVPLSSILKTILTDLEHNLLFYTSCLVEIIEHLTTNNIIYRDLNSQNILVDEKGYLSLCNFSLATLCADRSYTVLGSPYYMSPEMIMLKGYNSCATYWSLGIVLFEILCKDVPFGAKETDPIKIYEMILEKRIIYNKESQNVLAGKNIIEQLLCKNPEMRMPGGVSKFKTDVYFNNINWDLLKLKKIRAPVIPSSSPLNFADLQGIDCIADYEAINDFSTAWDEGF